VIARNVSAGWKWENGASPVGTAQFSRTHFSAAITGLFSMPALAAEVRLLGRRILIQQLVSGRYKRRTAKSRS